MYSNHLTDTRFELSIPLPIRLTGKQLFLRCVGELVAIVALHIYRIHVNSYIRGGGGEWQ